MKKVYASQDRLMINHFKNILNIEGIPCVIKNEYLTMAMGEIPLNECWLELWVEKDLQWEKAQTVIEEALNSEVAAGPNWKCLKCGEEIEPQFAECWNCGTKRKD